MIAKPENKPIIIPEPFSGEKSWEDWIDQLHSIPEINCLKDEHKLMWYSISWKYFDDI